MVVSFQGLTLDTPEYSSTGGRLGAFWRTLGANRTVLGEQLPAE